MALSITVPYAQASALAHLAAALANSDDLDRAEALARSIADPYQQARALVGLAAAVAGSELDRAQALVDRTEGLARSITWPDEGASALAVLAMAVADSGDLDRAEALARSITDPHRQARSLADLAKVATMPRARLFAASALRLDRWTTPLDALTRVEPAILAAIADELSNVGQAESA